MLGPEMNAWLDAGPVQSYAVAVVTVLASDSGGYLSSLMDRGRKTAICECFCFDCLINIHLSPVCPGEVLFTSARHYDHTCVSAPRGAVAQTSGAAVPSARLLRRPLRQQHLLLLGAEARPLQCGRRTHHGPARQGQVAERRIAAVVAELSGTVFCRSTLTVSWCF